MGPRLLYGTIDVGAMGSYTHHHSACRLNTILLEHNLWNGTFWSAKNNWEEAFWMYIHIYPSIYFWQEALPSNDILNTSDSNGF
jgi:hypothetical protein